METNYVALLKNTFDERGIKNTSYSLRAFARDLEIDPGQLSRIFHGKSQLSHESAKHIAVKAFDNKKHRDYFVAMVDYTITKKESFRLQALDKLKKLTPPNSNYKSLDTDAIHLIANWYNISILDLCSLPKFNPSIQNISKYLGLTKAIVKKSIDLLERSDLIKIEKSRWVKTHKYLKYNPNTPSFAIREFHKSMIKKAIKSIDKQKFKDRIIAGKTMTIKKEDLPKYNEYINDFLENIAQISTIDQECDSLYQLNIQLFNLKN